MEVWMPVQEWPYEVSDLGRVRRAVCARTNTNSSFPGRLKQPGLNASGYYVVALYDGDRDKRELVHRLVARAFLGDPPPGRDVVNHKNGAKTDNRPANLEWCTRAENCAHAGRTGLTSRGDDHCHAKITSAIVSDMRRRFDGSWSGVVALAAEHNIHPVTAYDAIVGRTWAHLPGVRDVPPKTHCKRGHLLAGENLAPWKLAKGVRECLACMHLRKAHGRVASKERAS